MTTQPNSPKFDSDTDNPNGTSDSSAISNPSAVDPSPAEITVSQPPTYHSVLPLWSRNGQPSVTQDSPQSPLALITFMAIAILILGLTINNFWVGISGAIVTLLLSLPVIWPPLRRTLIQALSPQERL